MAKININYGITTAKQLVLGPLTVYMNEQHTELSDGSSACQETIFQNQQRSCERVDCYWLLGNAEIHIWIWIVNTDVISSYHGKFRTTNDLFE